MEPVPPEHELHCREKQRPPQWKQAAVLQSGGGPSVISDFVNH